MFSDINVLGNFIPSKIHNSCIFLNYVFKKLLDISVISIFPKVVISLVTNFSSPLLFLMMVYCLSWINSSLIDMSAVKRA